MACCGQSLTLSSYIWFGIHILIDLQKLDDFAESVAEQDTQNLAIPVQMPVGILIFSLLALDSHLKQAAMAGVLGRKIRSLPRLSVSWGRIKL